VIQLERVSRVFRVGETEVRALDDVSEHIETGEHVALMGPSGSGKSTLLNVLGCLDRPSSGSYRLDGREVGALDDAALTEVRRLLVGFVFQSFHLVPRLTASENVELPMLFGGVARAERRERAAAGLAAVGLGPRADHRPDQLSGGERQRVAIARAMVMRPRLLLADEPTGNLDPATTVGIMRLLDRINRTGTTVVMATHDQRIVDAMRRRVMELDHGSLVRDQARGVYGVGS
jgi:putative ABC transport system ATP-binding protein